MRIAEILRRGFESVLANWPLLIIRFIESVVMLIIVLVAIFAAVVPAIASAAMGKLPFNADTDPSAGIEQLLAFLAANAPLILYSLVLILVVLTVAIGVHSFVTAGSVRIYVDSMQHVRAAVVTTREQMNAFTTDRWFAGAKSRWWTVFWIYNVAWSVASLFVLIPLVVIAGLVFALHDNAPAAVIAGCLGIALTVLILIPVGIVTGIWTQRAIVDCVARGTAAVDSLRAAWLEFRSDLGRHLAIAAIMFVVSFGVAIVVGGFSSMATLGQQHPNPFLMLPMQFSTSILNSIVSAAVGLWFLACFSALAVDRP